MNEEYNNKNNETDGQPEKTQYVPIPDLPPIQFGYMPEQTDPPEKQKPGKKKPKKHGISVSAFVITVLCAVLATFMATYVIIKMEPAKSIEVNSSGQSGDVISDAESTIRAIDEVVRQQFLYEIDDSRVYDYMIKGYMAGLGDKYAEYYNPEEYGSFLSETNADMEGIGVSVVMNYDEYVIQIIDVFPDSPAAEAGLSPGDYIADVMVDGEMKAIGDIGYDVALSYLRGKSGTYAEFTVYEAPDYNEPKEYRIMRRAVVEQSVTGRIYSEDKTVGIIRISGFNAKTPEQFTEKLAELQVAGAEKFIFDVRNNPGGELQSVCTILDLLLPEGPVVRVIYNDGYEEVVYTSDENELTFPMVVLANENTASAGELFTCALKDYEKATVVGVNTFGKGSIQTIAPLSDGGGIKYTYGYYCPPFSDNYDGKGIAPDVEVELSEEASEKSFYTLTDTEDNQLTAAYEELQKIK